MVRPIPFRMLYACHRFLLRQNDKVITASAFYQDVFHTGPDARYWVEKVLTELDSDDLVNIKPGELEVWVLPRAKSQGQAIQALFTIKESDWLPLDLDAAVDGVAIQRAWLHGKLERFDRVPTEQWPNWVLDRFKS